MNHCVHCGAPSYSSNYCDICDTDRCLGVDEHGDTYCTLAEERPTRTWKCERCNRTVERYRGMDDVQCECGAWYNSFGQRLRDDWMGNPSNWDENISDLDGYEIQHAGD